MTSSKQPSLFQRDSELQVPVDREKADSTEFLANNDRKLLIRASAGTGKTFQLSNRFLTLLRGTSPERILASTFTRKAAGEITDRILLRLAKAAIDQKDFLELQAFTGTPELTQEECLSLLKDLTQNLHRLRVSTLDGFFARLAGSFSLELHLPPGWRLMDDLEAEQLRDQAIDQVLREGNAQDLKTLMHQLDKGSVRRSVYQLIADCISDFHEIFLKTNEAAWNAFGNLKVPTDAELESAILRLEAEPVVDKSLVKARRQDLERMQEQDWEKLYDSGLLPKILRNEKYSRKEIPDNLKSAYLDLHPMIRARILAPWAQQTQATYHLLANFDIVYEKLKGETGGLRFDDVTRRLGQALFRRSTLEMAHRLDASIEHILLDEFQDTSIAQWDVLRPFAKEATSAHEKSFFCVGDVKQAIYGWRGGEAAIFDAIGQQLSGVVEQPLNKSFRSSPVVIDVVNRVFSGISNHDGFDEDHAVLRQWSDTFPRHETARHELPGYFRLLTSPFPDGVSVGNGSPQDEVAEFNRFVASMIKEQLEQCPQGTIGVLTRGNQKIGELIYELNRLGIDASEEGGNPLTDSAAVQLLLSLFQLTDHPGDTIARFHVSQSPLKEILDLPSHDDDEGSHRFAQRMRAWLLQQGYGHVVHDLTRQLAPFCNRRELRRLAQLSELAADFDTLPKSLRSSDFVEFVQKQKVQEPTDSRVRVMTVHQSKGLQFDTVILAECDGEMTRPPAYVSWTPAPGMAPEVVALYRNKTLQELFPEKLKRAVRQTSEKNITESLCLLYVAMTRAIHNLQVILRPRSAKSEEKHLPKTHGGLIRAALVPGSELKPAAVLAEIGDPKWYEYLNLKLPSVVPVRKAPKSLEMSFKKSQQMRRLSRLAPSGQEGTHLVRLANVLPVGGSAAVHRGTLMHAWIETVEWLDRSSVNEDSLRSIGIELGVQGPDLEEALRDFRKMLERASVRRLLSQRNYQDASALDVSETVRAEILQAPFDLEVRNERRFSVRRQQSLMTGSIDRLVTLRRENTILAAEIIDFKTDMLPDDLLAINERVEFYRGQIEAYIEAVALFYKIPVERISAKLALLNLGRVMTVVRRQREANAQRGRLSGK